MPNKEKIRLALMTLEDAIRELDTPEKLRSYTLDQVIIWQKSLLTKLAEIEFAIHR